ncbi:hypothetical protein Tco_1163173 [Tanacetum coccineum]
MESRFNIDCKIRDVTRLVVQVKELVLHQWFLMNHEPNPLTQMKELVLHQSEDERTESEKETTKSGKHDDDMSIDFDESDNEEDEHVDVETQRDEYVHDDEYVHEDDEYVHEEYEHVHNYVEEELNDAEIAKTIEGDKELTVTNKVEVEKTEEAKGDKEHVDDALIEFDQAKDASSQANQASALISVTQKGKPDLPPISSSLFVSSGFVIPKPTVLTPILEVVIEAPVTTIPSLILVLPSISLIIQQSTPVPTPTITTEAPSFPTVFPESKALSALQLRVSELEKEVKEPKQVDHSTTLLASFRYEVPSAVNDYLGSNLGDALQKVLQKHTANLIQQYSLKQLIDPMQKESQKSGFEICKIKLEHAEKQQKS